SWFKSNDFQRHPDYRSEVRRPEDRKFDKPARGGAREISNRGPKLSEEYTTFTSPVKMRTRKHWKKRSNPTEEED
ncbi:MAG: hypothetical protein K2G78_06065, partial [Muribaculaceae bacterium]|nr:hypothetical protein [Muribaculaceae bacterium]